MSGEAVTIRPAVSAEAPAVWQLTREAYAPYLERLHPPSGVFKETVEDVRRARDEGTIYVALREPGPEMVGAARVQSATHTHALYCGRVAVRPAAQRSGIGTALMREAERHARQGGFPAVVLGVRLELPENMAYYTRLGYRIVSEESHPGHSAPTFAWMRKDLA